MKQKKSSNLITGTPGMSHKQLWEGIENSLPENVIYIDPKEKLQPIEKEQKDIKKKIRLYEI